MDLIGTVAGALAVFAGTNLDDLAVITVLFLAGRAGGRPRPAEVWVGQYAGIGVLVAVSIAAATGLSRVPDRWAGLLGFVPIALGVRGLIAAVRAPAARPDGAQPAVAAGVWSVTAVTVGNGGDNLAVYVPLFRTLGATATVVTVVVFAGAVALWCLAGSWLGSHRGTIELVERWGHWLVPAVLVAIGVAIVWHSGLLGG